MSGQERETSWRRYTGHNDVESQSRRTLFMAGYQAASAKGERDRAEADDALRAVEGRVGELEAALAAREEPQERQPTGAEVERGTAILDTLMQGGVATWFPPSERIEVVRDILVAAREEPRGDDAMCQCGHIAHWHGAQGKGSCEHDEDCACAEFSLQLLSDTIICCDHGKIATAHCEMSGDGLVTLGELIESYSNPPLTAREDTERPSTPRPSKQRVEIAARALYDFVCKRDHEAFEEGLNGEEWHDPPPFENAYVTTEYFEKARVVLCAVRDTERPDGEWSTTGRLDTGTGRREWMRLDERVWTDDPDGPPREDTERPVYEVERDRFGTMYSGPLEVGECVRVVPTEAVACRPASIEHFVTTRAWCPVLDKGATLADAITQAIADGILAVRDTEQEPRR